MPAAARAAATAHMACRLASLAVPRTLNAMAKTSALLLAAGLLLLCATAATARRALLQARLLACCCCSALLLLLSAVCNSGCMCAAPTARMDRA